jgi:hypothetical protein
LIYGKGTRPGNRLSNSPVRAVKRARRRSRVPLVAGVLALVLGLAALVAALFLLDGRESVAPPSTDDWAEVLLKKREWAEAAGRGDPGAAGRRQEWADAVARFAEANPGHTRAREVHEDLVREHARELGAAGRYAEAVAVYESLIARRPDDAALRAELAAVVERQTVSRDQLQRVGKGASASEVEEALGAPPPGWIRESGEVTGWYYPRAEGGVAAVFLNGGRVFAVEYEAQEAAAPPPPEAQPLQ